MSAKPLSTGSVHCSLEHLRIHQAFEGIRDDSELAWIVPEELPRNVLNRVRRAAGRPEVRQLISTSAALIEILEIALEQDAL